jgi:hypothetical protein
LNNYERTSMGKHAEIVKQIEARIADLPPGPGSCLFYANAVAGVLHRHGRNVVLQAGSLQWPRLKPEENDGQVATHFAYMWSPTTPESIASIFHGNLPEMHVWCGEPETQILIDFSTRNFTMAAAKLGLAWTAPEPPKYLWTSVATLPPGVVYRPIREATLLACRVLQRLYKPLWLPGKD